MSQPLLVERALALVPRLDEYLPLIDTIIGTSATDHQKLWTRSNEYATVSKRIIDTAVLRQQVPEIAERAKDRLQQLYGLIVEAIDAQQSGNPAAAAEALVRAGELEEAGQWYDKAEQFYSLALHVAENLKNSEPRILALRRLGRASRSMGRLHEAWEWYEQSYNLAEAALDVPGQVIACQGFGNLCDDWGQRVRARAWYATGLARAAPLQRPDLTWPFHTNLAALAIQDGDLAHAEAELALARKTIEAAGAGPAMLFWYNNQGLLAQGRENPAAAEKVYREGLQHSQTPFWEMRLRINLGQSLVSQGRLFEAAEQARRAEDLTILYRTISFLVDVYLLLGAIAREQKDEDGFVFYEQALGVAREQNLPPIKVSGVYHQYGLFLLACCRDAEGLTHLEHARELYHELQLPVETAKVEADLLAAGARPGKLRPEEAEAEPVPLPA